MVFEDGVDVTLLELLGPRTLGRRIQVFKPGSDELLDDILEIEVCSIVVAGSSFDAVNGEYLQTAPVPSQRQASERRLQRNMCRRRAAS